MKTVNNLWKDVPIWKKPPKEINVVIEIPRRSRNKYEYQHEGGYFKLDRVIYSSVHYPMDYGFIPQTLSDDGDPLDTLVMTEEATFPGCVIETKAIGVLRMEDETGIDDKILAAPIKDPRKSGYDDIEDVNEHKRTEIYHFFSVYKELEKHKWVEIKDWLGADKAKKIINNAIKKYEEEVDEDV